MAGRLDQGGADGDPQFTGSISTLPVSRSYRAPVTVTVPRRARSARIGSEVRRARTTSRTLARTALSTASPAWPRGSAPRDRAASFASREPSLRSWLLATSAAWKLVQPRNVIVTDAG